MYFQEEDEMIGELVKKIDSDIAAAKPSLEASEKIVEEGNTSLKACAKKMHIPTFTEGQQKVELGLKRKRELEQEILALDIKKAKLAQKINS